MAIVEKLKQKIIKYYFNNPDKNSTKEMEDKFKVSGVTIKKIISKDLEQRLENSLTRRFLKKYD